MFKHTGIVRRIDNIGRIVIPKEVRHKFRIHEGDPIEIGEDGDFIALKQYSVMEFGGEVVRKILISFSKTTSHPVVLCSTTHTLNSFRIPMKTPEYLTRKLCDALHHNDNTCLGYEITDESRIKVRTLERINIGGIVEGVLIIPQTSANTTVTDADKACLKLCTNQIAELLG